MITGDALGTMRIRRIIFHDVPRRLKGIVGAPTLSEIDTDIEERQRQHLVVRLVRALGSKSAYDVEFDPTSGSPVPGYVREYTVQADDFVAMSQALARYLYEQQPGSSSPGLLAVIDCLVESRASLAVLKLEREEGAQLELSKREGKQTFAMSVLENLVLTDGTRLFKNALFVRTGAGPNDFSAITCDNQRSFPSTDELAQFWQRFLGCRLTIEPRIATKRFFEATVEYINTHVDDPVLKNTIFEHIVSELTSEKRTFAPRSFIEDYLPSKHRESFQSFIKEQNIPLKQFPLDVSEIASRLRRKAIHTEKGVTVSVPMDHSDVVKIDKTTITVTDTVTRVDTK